MTSRPSQGSALLVVTATAAAALACGGGERTRRQGAGGEEFDCNSRRVEYMVVGGFVAPEAGISMLCDGDRPRIITWREESAGDRRKRTFPITPGQFDATWQQVDSTGWRFLGKKCDNPEAVKGDPIYTIDVGDHATTVSLVCPGKELPFPYDRLVNELDLRAAGLGDGP